ncbi:MAG: hypothetical protein HYX69_06530 [Planctomycetia bacterium]|nr:hypothetical protein [Planctomycetia bacterium]
MRRLFQTVTDFRGQADVLRAARCGRIEVRDERFVAVSLRPWARHASHVEALLWGRFAHHARPGNHCWLYYHQPRRFPNFLVLSYVISGRGTTLATLRGALRLLDEIARLRGADALLCDVATSKISDRLLARWGWAPHAPRRWHRPFIKRFYGRYPPADEMLEALLSAPRDSQSAVPQMALCR